MLDQEHQMNQYVLRYWVYNHQLVWLLLFSSGMLRRSLTHQETVRLTLYEVISLSLSFITLLSLRPCPVPSVLI